MRDKIKEKVKPGRRSAMTLIEIFIAVGILSIIIAASQQVFIMGDKTWQRDMELTHLQNEARRSLDALSKNLRGATNVALNASATDEIQFDTLDDSSLHYYLYNSSYGGVGTVQQIIYDQTVAKTCTSSWDDNDCQVQGSYIEELYFCCWNGGTCNQTCDSSTPLEIRLRAAKPYRSGDNLMYPKDDNPADANNFYLKSVFKLRNE